jgi:hypothetical protein
MTSFDVLNLGWTALNPSFIPRAGHSMVHYGSSFYVFGAGPITPTMERYDLESENSIFSLLHSILHLYKNRYQVIDFDD